MVKTKPEPEKIEKIALPPNLKISVALDDPVVESCTLIVSTEQSTCGGLTNFGGVVTGQNFKLILPPIISNENSYTCQITNIVTTCFLSNVDQQIECNDVANPKLPQKPSQYYFTIVQSGGNGCALVPDY